MDVGTYCLILTFCSRMLPDRLQADMATNTSVTLHWQLLPESPYVVYCIVYHSAFDHRHDDVHSSSYAVWMERTTAIHLKCTSKSSQNITNLIPGTEYHIDLLARDTKTLRETTFMGLTVTTIGHASPSSPWQHKRV